MAEKLYYVQSVERGFVGNAMVWWRQGCYGYVTDIREAHVWTQAMLDAYPIDGVEDIPWPKAVIDDNVSFEVTTSPLVLRGVVEQTTREEDND